jgi:hypothetical protein
MTRMLSRVHPSFCPDSGVDKKTQRAREKRQWRREVTS